MNMAGRATWVRFVISALPIQDSEGFSLEGKARSTGWLLPGSLGKGAKTTRIGWLGDSES